MAAVPIADLLKLDVTERLRVIEVLWNSIIDSGEELPLGDEERAELDRRLAAHAANPDAGSTWEEVKARLGR